MSKSPQNTPLHELQNEAIKTETLKELAEKLQEFSQTLLTLCRQNQTQDDFAESENSFSKEADQIRCYRIPAFMLKVEQETLKEHRADNLLDLLLKAYQSFYITSFLLRNFRDDEDVNGFTIQQIGEQLAYPLKILNRLCAIFGDYYPQTPAEGIAG